MATSTSSSSASTRSSSGPEVTDLTFQDLETITNKFSVENRVGNGTYGEVYRGEYNGSEIAVKRLFVLNGYDHTAFANEFGQLMKVRHENIIRLIAYCHETKHILIEIDGQKLFSSVIERALCFEYMPRGSLANHISDEPCIHDWATIYKIIRGTCEGLHYLHKGRGEGDYIYHLDLNPDNILLDKDMTPKIAGFGSSRLFGESKDYESSSPMKGALGFMPPEYINNGTISPKNDVFSLGVIIFYLMAGRNGYCDYCDSRSSCENFTKKVQVYWKKKMRAAVSHYTLEEIELLGVKICIELAMTCVVTDRAKRPSTQAIIDELHRLDVQIKKMSEEQEAHLLSSFQYLKGITNNFSEERIVGEGGSGVVYRGELHNGKLVAVKKVNTMCKTEGLCEKSKRLFETEVALLMRLEHPNIVQALNYCYEMKQKLQGGIFIWQIDTLLCLEYLPEGSLHDRISDATSGLDWRTRYKIVKGISYGLRYLHEQPDAPIIHLDLKPANILLDANMVPKIADFGISRLYKGKTIHTGSSDGTQGYKPPEYILRSPITPDTIKRGIITPKSDIFSLGVIIMEIITGHKDYPFDINEATSQEFIHNELGEWRIMLEKEPWNANLETDCQQVEKCIRIGLECVNHDRTKRPTIREITDMLEGLGSTNC